MLIGGDSANAGAARRPFVITLLGIVAVVRLLATFLAVGALCGHFAKSRSLGQCNATATASFHSKLTSGYIAL